MSDRTPFSAFRFYFYDARTGAELTEHELNGTPAGQHGCAVASSDNRTWFRGLRMRADLYLCCNFARKVFGLSDGRKITTADFGGKTVLVKTWGPNGYRDEFYLISNDVPAWRIERPELAKAA